MGFVICDVRPVKVPSAVTYHTILIGPIDSDGLILGNLTISGFAGMSRRESAKPSYPSERSRVGPIPKQI